MSGVGAGIIKGIFANLHKSISQRKIGKFAGIKRILANGGHRVGNSQCTTKTAAAKGTFADRGYRAAKRQLAI